MSKNALEMIEDHIYPFDFVLFHEAIQKCGKLLVPC